MKASEAFYAIALILCGILSYSMAFVTHQISDFSKTLMRNPVVATSYETELALAAVRM